MMTRRRLRRSFWIWPTLFVLGAGLHAFAEPRDSAGEDRRGAEASIETKRTTRLAGSKPTSCQRTRPKLDLAAGKRIVRLDIHDEIDLGLAPHVQRVVDEAGAAGDVALIVIHMNTPGGRVDAAEMIKDALLRSKVPTATVIDTGAFSAGALIAYATDFIIVTPGASMGAATPILIGQDGDIKDAGEKMVSALRSMFRATAEAKGRDTRIAEAMVDRDVDIPGLKPDGKLVTLTRTELLEWCVADLSANDLDGAIKALGASDLPITHYEVNWAEQLARFFTSSAVAGALMSIGMLGLMIELYTPGFGLGGIVALVCFTLYFGGHLFVQLVGIEEFLLLLVGVGLVIFEVVVPGHIIPGVLGVVAILAALILAMVGSDLSLSWSAGVMGDALFKTAMALVGSIALFALLARYLPKSRFVGRLVHSSALAGGSFDAPTVDPRDGDVRVGALGRALTLITGSGKGQFGEMTLDVVSDGSFIPRGSTIVVIEIRPGRIVVALKEPS